MKWILSRKNFLTTNEAKIRDVIFDKQKSAIINNWGEQYLDLDEIQPTDKIKEGKWKLDQEDKIKIFSAFFKSDIAKIYECLGKLPIELDDVIKKSIDVDMISKSSSLDENYWSETLKEFSIRTPTIDQISQFNRSIFRKLSVSDMISSEIIVKDSNGRPIMGEDGKPQKRKKEDGEVIFTNNLTNINTFISDYKRCFPDQQIDTSIFDGNDIDRLITIALEDMSSNSSYQFELNIFSKDMYLYIKHTAKDILNMSISKFYSSCQHLYDGGYREQVIGNVFDPNSTPAYIVFDTPIKYNGEIISDQLPLCRIMVRNIETFTPTEDKEPKIFFDRCYPDRVKDAMDKVIEKYSGNKQNVDDESKYLFTPDMPIDLADRIRTPYMDRMGLIKGNFIGVNCKSLYLSSTHDWSKTLISKTAKIVELIIATNVLPSNFFEMNMKPEWIKFKNLVINDVGTFSKIKTKTIAFDKCKFESNIITQFKDINNGIDKLQIIACDIPDLNLSMIDKLDELHLLYTFDGSVETLIDHIKIKKLVVSSDILSDDNNKKYINSLKRKGVKVEITGPKI